MTQLPDPILDIARLTNDEHPIYKSNDALLSELITKFNQLLQYLQEQEKR